MLGVVDRNAVSTYRCHCRREVIDLDREVRWIGSRILWLEQMYLAITNLEPCARILRVFGSIDRLEPEHVSVEGKGCVGVVHHQRNVVQPFRSGSLTAPILPVVA